MYFDPVLNRLVMSPKRDTLTGCPAKNYSEARIKHRNQVGWDVDITKQMCIFQIQLKVFDQCDNATFYF